MDTFLLGLRVLDSFSTLLMALSLFAIAVNEISQRRRLK